MAGTLTTYAQCKLQVSRMKLNICDSAQFLRGGGTSMHLPKYQEKVLVESHFRFISRFEAEL